MENLDNISEPKRLHCEQKDPQK